MKPSIKIILMITVVITASAVLNSSKAQCNMMGMNHSSHENHSSAKPNDSGAMHGEIIRAGSYQFEIVFQPLFKTDAFTVYVMNKKGKPLTKADISGSVDITYQDGSSESVSLFAKGENSYAVPLKNLSQPFVSLFNIQIDKKNVAVRYEYKGENTTQNNSTGSYFTCPMHPEIKSDKPGNCPKCGMKLQQTDNK